MARSQNGYSANDVNLTSVRTIPGTNRKIRLRTGPAGDLLLWVLGQFDARVEDLDAGQLDDWGYAERPIRGGTVLSNHASGTAADANAVRHPLGTDPAATFSKAQIAAIRAIVARTEGCVRWGGDYVGRKDPMHFEIVAPESRCAAVLHKLTAAGGGDTTGKGFEDVSLNDKLKLWDGSEVTVAQALAGMLGRIAPLYADLVEGQQSRVYPHVKAPINDFVTGIDENVIVQGRKIAELEKASAAQAAKLDEILALLKKGTGQ
ncbi:M15 family metallopeptidase [Amycolatopsis roodepoortensis]|uniref:M15 family metallopeptidase n=1 Tax=Amycolatopsis roodepoortensis TaxID=700274 RepID=UPI00214CBC38|nr:M15 family metallopeptidase [Amycolatopsis roodepoortensis]UUV34371.1 M15 family metallopeptidase [Amycolatopsis roodepoortensis]